MLKWLRRRIDNHLRKQDWPDPEFCDHIWFGVKMRPNGSITAGAMVTNNGHLCMQCRSFKPMASASMYDLLPAWIRVG